MIEYEKFELKNGLKVIFHQDKTTPMAVVNIMYDVGARDEDPNRTGFAHLFEHLMFGGSANIPNFDAPLQLVGGECNAFTNNDITNYYDILPIQNIETAFWLESDRMLQLAFTPKSLEVQRQVVIEEFKQRYLNQPYGDVWLQLRPLIYKEHPYQWATIGKNIQHIEEATMDDVKDFFYSHYGPQNATLVVGGNTTKEEVEKLANKWFGDIPKRDKKQREIKPEPTQNEFRELEIEREVPANAVYLAFRMGSRLTAEHYLGDLLSDILSRGKSSRLYKTLIEEEKLFSGINAYITGGWEDGLIIVSGNLLDDTSFEEAETKIWEQLNLLINERIENRELEKVKNKFKTAKVFSEQTLMNRVLNLAMFETMGKLEEINDELQQYDSISASNLQEFATKTFKKENTSVLRVKAKS